MKTNKPLTLAATFAFAISLAATGTAAASTQSKTKVAAPNTPVAVKAAGKTAKLRKATKRSKLPREWVWKKYAKNFDSMYRR